MYDFKSKSRYMVKDWTPYPDEFPLRDPSCLLRPASSTAVDVAAMHAEDARDDSLIAQEQAVAALTRAQSKAISAATNSPLDIQPSALADKPTPSLDTALKAPSPSSPPEITSRQTPLRAGSPLDMPFTQMSELDLARALLKHNYPIVLPTRYAPFDKPTPEGKMVVVGVKAQKTSATKAVLWVRFTSPPSYVGHQIQLYPKSLEPKNGPAKGADFSILSALASTYPQATTLRHLGITEQTSSQMTTAMMAVFLQYRAGTPFSASALDDGTAGNLKQTTSEQNPMLLDELAVEAGLVMMLQIPTLLKATHAQRKTPSTVVLCCTTLCGKNSAKPRTRKWRGYGERKSLKRSSVLLFHVKTRFSALGSITKLSAKMENLTSVKYVL